MFERTLYVKYISEKNNFIYLPFGLKFLKTGTCLQLSYNEQQNFYTSVHSIVPYLDDESIGLNALLAQALGIGENESVILHELSQLPSITSITIYTSFKEEYEVIEILSENIQETLLNQIRVLDSRQKFIIWIGQYIEILVNVDGVEPVSPGAIDFLTEVHIKLLNYDTQKTPLDTSINTKNINIKVSEGLAKYFNGGELHGQDKTLALKYFENKLGLVYRLVPLKALPLSKEITGCLKPFDVFITKEEITEYQLKESVSVKKSIYSLTNIFSGVYPEVTEKTIYVNLLPLENILKHHTLNLSQTLFVDDQVLNFFKYGLGHKVILKQIANPSHVSEIIICTKKNDSTDIIEEFKKYLAQGSDEVFLLNAHVPMAIGDNIVCSLKFFPPEGYCLVDDYLVRNCKYLIEYDDVKIIQYKTREEIVKNDLKFYENISNYKNIVDDVFHTFTSIGNGSFENVLITGKPGTGKTSLLKHICLRLQKYPYYFHVKMIECKSLEGKTMGTMMTHLNSIFSELVLRQPSILFLDDIHELCGCTQSGDTTLKDIIFDRITDMLQNLFKENMQYHQIGICASTESIEKMHTNLYSSRGIHLFKNVYSIRDYTKIDRISVLQNLFENEKLNYVNFEELSIKTEGFVMEDLVNFCHRAVHEASKNALSIDDPVIINNDHCENALKNTFVISLANVKLHSPGENDFSDIGGLQDIKRVLVENLLWPVQYPSIFSKAPLRQQSGLLLYGPPGTGKTLLAAAAAKQCGLRLISVKGPELLSKYIGASEKAVRDIFEKALSVRPCILFFDEFDSLAPRRGHDNTGVTDRVVNQLLTQLDGVESLTGVCVLAATSRPELLDPALLRPGRIDKQLLCPLPDQTSRLEILTVLSKKISLAPDVDLEFIAKETENFTGADLKSLTYSAQLSTIDYLLENNNKSDDTQSKVTHQHFLEALAKTKPSLSVHERLRYERIYAKFRTGSTIETGLRATMA